MKKILSLLLLFTASFALVGCDDTDTPDEYSYEDFVHLSNFDQIQTQSEDSYLVYFYADTCSHCSLIKDIVLDFVANNDKNVTVYLIDAYNVQGTNYVDGMNGTPTLLTIVDGQIVDMNVGSLAIPTTLNDILEGYYAYLR